MAIVQFELNEVPFRVIDAFVAREPKSNIAQLLKQATQIRSLCEDEVELDPWISWPTLHRGVNDRQHHILHLGQILDKPDRLWPPIWRIIADAGLKVGVFGSVHSSHVPADVEKYAFYVPDFFDDEVFAHPAYLRPFQRFNLGMTRRSARNVDTKVPGDLLMDFAKSAPRLGLGLDTVTAVSKQLINERSNPRLRIRRRSLQSLIMGDVFVSLLRKHRPDFATFYTNNVAASMHRYWAAAFPDDYQARSMSDDWINDYGDEIHDAMSTMDKTLGKLLAYCRQTGTLFILATSMGQAAVKHEETRQFVSMKDTNKFMQALGFDASDYRVRHAMVPCGGVVVDPSIIPALTAKLDQIRIDGKTMVQSENEVTPLSYGVHDAGFVSFFSYFESYTGEQKIQIGNEVLDFEDAGFGFTAHEDGVSVTAHHVAEGALLIFDPQNPLADTERPVISTLAVAPAILKHFGIEPPEYMKPADGLIYQKLVRQGTDGAARGHSEAA